MQTVHTTRIPLGVRALTAPPSCLHRRPLRCRASAPPVAEAPQQASLATTPQQPASLATISQQQEDMLPSTSGAPPTVQQQEDLRPSTSGAPPPWTDERWTKLKWTVYRGTAYDMTTFLARHPGGNWLLNLAIGRDCTALLESYHLRPEVAVAHLKRLPVLQGFPTDAVPRSPYPNDSEVYVAIRERVRQEVFKGQDYGSHRVGSEGVAVAVLTYALAAYGLYTWQCNPATGLLLGLAGAWVGLTIQHCGNHGAMSNSATVNKLMGLTNDVFGGSSLLWRYHHQVSHHIHCNDQEFDEDVFSLFPFVRLDARMPKYWFHQFQHIYMWMAFPLLQLIFQFGDWVGLIEGRTAGATMYGASDAEKATVVVGKLVHYGLLFVLPWALHGGTAALVGAAAYIFAQSIVLATTFAVSHNVAEVKPDVANQVQGLLYSDLAGRDWGAQQILTSANWGGAVGNFFTGGLNLQIEHHLFPAVSFMHYPAIAKIVEQEARKRGISYTHYPTLPEILVRFVSYMAEVGVQEQVPMGLNAPASRTALGKL